MELNTYEDKQFTYGLSTKLFYGFNVVREKIVNLLEQFEDSQVSNIFIITDNRIRTSGTLEIVEKPLKKAGYTFNIYEKEVNEPTENMVSKAFREVKEHKPTLLIAVGGGGVIDLAKVLKISCDQFKQNNMRKISPKKNENTIPLIAIPTTAGTGTETGSGAVIIDSINKEKFLIDGNALAPEIALVDPLLTFTVPTKITAYTGLDALSQAIGAYTSNFSQPVTDVIALSAVKTIVNNIRKCVAKGDKQSRCNMALGSMMSGIAMNHADCIADHIFGETLGAYFNLPHGLTVAFFLPYILNFNKFAVPEKMLRIARALGANVDGLTMAKAAKIAVEAVFSLLEDLEIPSLKDVDIKESDISVLVDKTVDRMKNFRANPRHMCREDIENIYHMAYNDKIPN